MLPVAARSCLGSSRNGSAGPRDRAAKRNASGIQRSLVTLLHYISPPVAAFPPLCYAVSLPLCYAMATATLWKRLPQAIVPQAAHAPRTFSLVLRERPAIFLACSASNASSALMPGGRISNARMTRQHMDVRMEYHPACPRFQRLQIEMPSAANAFMPARATSARTPMICGERRDRVQNVAGRRLRHHQRVTIGTRHDVHGKRGFSYLL